MNPLIIKSPVYTEIVSRGRKGEQILDVGSFLGVDLRTLAADGAPPSGMHAMDVVDFWPIGLEMFRDADRFSQVDFVRADLIDAGPPPEFLALQGKMDVVLITHVLHQWPWHRQVEGCVRLASLTRGVGSLIVGFQVGSIEPGEKVDRRYTTQESFAHDIISFEKMWTEVGEKSGTEWTVEAQLVSWEEWEWKPEWVAYLGEDKRGLQFAVRRVL